MDIVLRVIGIVIEVILLTAVVYALLKGVKLTLFDLGLGQKYDRATNMVLIALSCIVVIFFIAHLVTFYPPI